MPDIEMQPSEEADDVPCPSLGDGGLYALPLGLIDVAFVDHGVDTMDPGDRILPVTSNKPIADPLSAPQICPGPGKKRRGPDLDLLPSKTRRMDPVMAQDRTDDRFSTQYVFRGLHGRHLAPFVISHSKDLQPYLDKAKITRGVQWELVRGIKAGLWDWKNLQARIGQLSGTNANIAPKVRSIMLGTPGRPPTSRELSLWEELDREAKAVVENKSRGLGLLGEFDGVADYYGGKVQCTIRLVNKKDNEKPDVHLEPLQMTRSTHLARDLGSLSVIALKDDSDGQLVKTWATHKFILCGRVYVALPPSSGKVYLIETDEDYMRNPEGWCGDQYRISYDECLRRNNPMDLNASQPFAKYLTRMSLYLSTSIPALEFKTENIHFIDDQYADGCSKRDDLPAEKIMTDGSGFINRAAALEIKSKLKYIGLPVAYQGRIAGSKGLWIVHPTDLSTTPEIWIRLSQQKIFLRRLTRPHRIFNLLAMSAASPSSIRLTAQSVVILANNGVSTGALCSLQERGLRNLIEPLMDWTHPHASAYLWNAIDHLSSNTRSRLQRLAGGASRALGLTTHSYGNSGQNDDMEHVTELGSVVYAGRNVFSGEPLTVSEAALDLLQAGFDPCTSRFLSQKLHTLIKKAMDAYLGKYKIAMEGSAEAYIIPDPTGQLQDGQVFYRSSTDPETPLRQQVIIGRYPMRESSDMQKVTAVNVPDLENYVDVLVMSVHGSRSLASLLAGGDHVIIICDPLIVKEFQNQPVIPVPTGFQSANFEQQVHTVARVGLALAAMSTPLAQLAFQRKLSDAVAEARIGRYSLYHDCAVYNHGLDDVRTRRLAHMSSALLDCSKTGLRLLHTVEAADEKEFGGKHPQRARCFDLKNGHTQRRPIGPFILDSLLTSGQRVKDALMVRLGTIEVIADSVLDSDIVEPYVRAAKVASDDGPLSAFVASDLALIENRIEDLRRRYRLQLDKSPYSALPKPGDKPNNKGQTKMADNPMTPFMEEFREPIAGLQCLDSLGSLDEIKASFAFFRSPSFAFSMAFHDVCDIKRKAVMKLGPWNRVAILDDARDMGAAARRLLKHEGH